MEYGGILVKYRWSISGIWRKRMVQSLYRVEEYVVQLSGIIFPPFRLDLVNEQLWREDQLLPLRPKAFAVLRCLVAQAGRLVTKEELLNSVWPDTRVNEADLTGYFVNLRDLWAMIRRDRAYRDRARRGPGSSGPWSAKEPVVSPRRCLGGLVRASSGGRKPVGTPPF